MKVINSTICMAIMTQEIIIINIVIMEIEKYIIIELNNDKYIDNNNSNNDWGNIVIGNIELLGVTSWILIGIYIGKELLQTYYIGMILMNGLYFIIVQLREFSYLGYYISTFIITTYILIGIGIHWWHIGLASLLFYYIIPTQLIYHYYHYN